MTIFQCQKEISLRGNNGGECMYVYKILSWSTRGSHLSLCFKLVAQKDLSVVIRICTCVGVHSKHKLLTQYSMCRWHHQILKSKTKERRKVFSSLGIRGTKFISVYNFPAQWRPSFGNQHLLNFTVMMKNIHISCDF